MWKIWEVSLGLPEVMRSFVKSKHGLENKIERDYKDVGWLGV
jgi:hypothetical protein